MTTQYEYLISYLNSRLKTTNGCHLGVILIMGGSGGVNNTWSDFNSNQTAAQNDANTANSDLTTINSDLADAQSQANTANTDAAEGNVAGAKAAAAAAQQDYNNAQALINAIPPLAADALTHAQANDTVANDYSFEPSGYNPHPTDDAYNTAQADATAASATVPPFQAAINTANAAVNNAIQVHANQIFNANKDIGDSPMFTFVEMIGQRGVGNFDLLDLVFTVSMEGGQVIDEINNSRSQEIERLNNWLHDNESYENQLIEAEDDVSGKIAKDIGNCSNAPSIDGPSDSVPIRTYDTSNLFGPDANGNPGTPIYSTTQPNPETLAVIQQAITQNNNVRTTVSDQIQQISQYITSDINYKNQLYSTLSNLYSAFFQSDSAINKNFVNS